MTICTALDSIFYPRTKFPPCWNQKTSLSYEWFHSSMCETAYNMYSKTSIPCGRSFVRTCSHSRDPASLRRNWIFRGEWAIGPSCSLAYVLYPPHLVWKSSPVRTVDQPRFYQLCTFISRSSHWSRSHSYVRTYIHTHIPSILNENQSSGRGRGSLWLWRTI